MESGLGVGTGAADGGGVGETTSVDCGFGEGSSLRIVFVNAESIGEGVGDRLLDGFGGAVVGNADGTGARSGGSGEGLSALPAA